jgi:hypothetical protein
MLMIVRMAAVFRFCSRPAKSASLIVISKDLTNQWVKSLDGLGGWKGYWTSEIAKLSSASQTLIEYFTSHYRSCLPPNDDEIIEMTRNGSLSITSMASRYGKSLQSCIDEITKNITPSTTPSFSGAQLAASLTANLKLIAESGLCDGHAASWLTNVYIKEARQDAKTLINTYNTAVKAAVDITTSTRDSVDAVHTTNRTKALEEFTKTCGDKGCSVDQVTVWCNEYVAGAIDGSWLVIEAQMRVKDSNANAERERIRIKAEVSSISFPLWLIYLMLSYIHLE